MNYIEKTKQIEKELDIILEKLKSDTSIEHKKLLYSKSALLLKKFSLLHRCFDNEQNEFLDNFKKTKIQAGILITLNIIVLLLNINLSFLVITTIMCGGFSYYVLKDIYKQKKEVDETIIFLQDHFQIVLDKVEECERYTTNNEKISINYNDYDYAIDFIMDYVVCNSYNINDISDNIKELVVKILKYDLKTNEDDIEKLLKEYKEYYKKDSNIKKLIKK